MLTAILLLSGMLLSAEPDTLQTAVVSAERGITISRTDTLRAEKALAVTDLLLKSPGLVVSDNGGFAGLKTVNLRGLGSSNTAIYIDGIKVGNVQSGQPDLGMLGLENFSGAMIDYAQNSVNFSTARPMFEDRDVAGKFSFGGGSFGTYLPQGRLDFRLSDKLSLSANAAGVLSKGNFPYGEGLERTNNDIKQVKAGLDFFGLTGGGDWMAKLYYNGSDRGTPGSVDWPSGDRQQDLNTFAQGLLRKNFSPLYSLNLSAKASYDDIHYASEWGDSDYGQTEFQLNSSHKFRVAPWLDLSAVAEFQWDGLKATLYDASRTNVTAIAGAALKFSRLLAELTLEYGGTFDKGGASHNVLSPSADIRITAFEGFDIVGFARRAYRTPTFNELYYPGFGNPDLRPEDALLTDFGFDYRAAFARNWAFKAKFDAFWNHLKDKIVSAPSPENPSLWFPYNIGEVRSYGFDADASLSYGAGDWNAAFSARYSFQNANDVPYLSKHTVVLGADASLRGWSLDAVWNLRAGRRDSYGQMPDWNTLDLTFAREISLGEGGAIGIKLSCRNFFDCRYELVSGYPMLPRSLMAGLEYRF